MSFSPITKGSTSFHFPLPDLWPLVVPNQAPIPDRRKDKKSNGEGFLSIKVCFLYDEPSAMTAFFFLSLLVHYFPPLFISLKLSVSSFLIFFQIHGLFFFICCCYIHFCTISSFCIIFLTCVCFQNWPFDGRWLIGGVVPGENYFPHSQHALVSCSSLCRVEASRAILHVHISMAFGVIIVWLLFRQSCWQDFVDIASNISRRLSLTENSLWLLRSFHSFFCNVSWALGAGIVL